MSHPATTLVGFGCYLLVLGAALLVFPNTVLDLFGMAPTVEVWIRVAGMLALVRGAYDVLAGLSDLREFIRWTMPMRATAAVFFALLVLLGYAPPVLLLLGFMEAGGAAWTWLALRRTRVVVKAAA